MKNFGQPNAAVTRTDDSVAEIVDIESIEVSPESGRESLTDDERAREQLAALDVAMRASTVTSKTKTLMNIPSPPNAHRSGQIPVTVPPPPARTSAPSIANVPRGTQLGMTSPVAPPAGPPMAPSKRATMLGINSAAMPEPMEPVAAVRQSVSDAGVAVPQPPPLPRRNQNTMMGTGAELQPSARAMQTSTANADSSISANVVTSAPSSTMRRNGPPPLPKSPPKGQVVVNVNSPASESDSAVARFHTQGTMIDIPQGSTEEDLSVDVEVTFDDAPIIAGQLEQKPVAKPMKRGFIQSVAQSLGIGKPSVQKTVGFTEAERAHFASKDAQPRTTQAGNSPQTMSPAVQKTTIAKIREVRPDLGEAAIAAILEYNVTPEAAITAAKSAPKMGVPETTTHGVERAGVAQGTIGISANELMDNEPPADDGYADLSQSQFELDDPDGDAPTTVVDDPAKASAHLQPPPMPVVKQPAAQLLPPKKKAHLRAVPPPAPSVAPPAPQRNARVRDQKSNVAQFPTAAKPAVAPPPVGKTPPNPPPSSLPKGAQNVRKQAASIPQSAPGSVLLKGSCPPPQPPPMPARAVALPPPASPPPTNSVPRYTMGPDDPKATRIASAYVHGSPILPPTTAPMTQQAPAFPSAPPVPKSTPPARQPSRPSVRPTATSSRPSLIAELPPTEQSKMAPGVHFLPGLVKPGPENVSATRLYAPEYFGDTQESYVEKKTRFEGYAREFLLARGEDNLERMKACYHEVKGAYKSTNNPELKAILDKIIYAAAVVKGVGDETTPIRQVVEEVANKAYRKGAEESESRMVKFMARMGFAEKAGGQPKFGMFLLTLVLAIVLCVIGYFGYSWSQPVSHRRHVDKTAELVHSAKRSTHQQKTKESTKDETADQETPTDQVTDQNNN